MLDISLKVLEEIVNHGYEAYIVGGFVRDYLLGNKSNDIDIATNATPKELREIFKEDSVSGDDYGSVTVIFKNIRFEITTFREEIGYVDNRRPAEIRYIDSLEKDLVRRDFTINAICIDSKGDIIDLLNGRSDLDKRIIKTIGDARKKFEEDALRILRAVRFATILNFDLDEEVVNAIKEFKYLIKNLSYQRKKEELDKIFSSPNAKSGIELILELGLDKELEIENLNKVEVTSSLISIWSVLDVSDKYPFTNNEKDLISKINEAINFNNLDAMNLYKYGLYVNSVAGEIKGLNIKDITEAYSRLAIQSRKDIALESDEIMEVLNKEPGSYLKTIYEDLENEILYRRLDNNKDSILNYIKDKYND